MEEQRGGICSTAINSRNQESQNLGTTTVYQIPRNCMLEVCCIVKAWSHCFIFENIITKVERF